jgi:beta-barrel assembly-enhancing protease
MRTRWLAAGLLLAGCSGASLPNLGGIPLESLGRIGQQALPIGIEKEDEIGFGIAAVVAGRYRLAPDESLQRYVELVGQTVAMASPRAGEIVFRFAVLDADDVNAFAAPGGWIFITRGALALMEDEAELAGVLAHEVAHVDEKHVLEQIRRSAVLGSARSESQLTGVVLDQVAAAGSGLIFTGLGRGDELEADSLGILYSAAVGYDPDGLRRFLLRLRDAQEGGRGAAVQGRLAEWRASHPPVDDRLAALDRQLAGRGVLPGAAQAGATVQPRFRREVGRP